MSYLIISIFILIEFLFPTTSLASHIELNECVEIAHCVREEWQVDSIEQPFKEIKEIIKNSPRTVILEIDRDYIHAEVESRFLKFIDDLEVTYLEDQNKIIIRSESRVGDGDFGVNQKRLNLLRNQFFDLDS